MANLHGYGEYQPDYQQRRQQRTLQDYFGDSIKRFPLIGAQVVKTNPRQMHYFEMLQNNYFPGYKIQSVTTLAIFVYTLLFTLCIFGGIEKQGQFLEINDATLQSHGGLVTNQIKNEFMFQQLFTSIFLSRDFYHYFCIVFFLLILLSSFEYASGPIIAISLYIFSGAMGALFGSSINCCTDLIYLHANTAIYGLIGAFFGCIILNWCSLEVLNEMRAFLCCFMWILLTFVLVITLSAINTNHNDKYGQIGGFITGFFLSLAIVPPMNQGSYEDKAKIFGWTFLGIFAFVSTLMIIVI
ncbi:unnamed protein product [Paramecium octaurelia]|uniref:Rhomboid-like protease n=1 Tax=Paramecium octaurelia TaxID=43137 RepID=A0A8S1SN28_PAROT|nr:unnamed protein product [Paramecium octaurelia]